MHNPLRLNKLPWMYIGALFFIVLLMLFDCRIAFRGAGQPPGVFRLSLGTSQAQAADAYTAHYGTKFVAVRSDIWNCYRIRDNVQFNFGLIVIPDRCQESYLVVVQTEACQPTRSEGFECTAGTWRWVPNPPCGNDNPRGWYLPPC